jgi:23S rRNA pseudouridine1911/1915/1917 synthase
MNQQPELIFENEELLALNKPSGMLSVPDRTQSEPSLRDWLENRKGKVFTVHRLDKDTSGLIIFAKTDIAHRRLSMQFENRELEKYYVGLVHGRPVNDSGSIEAAMMEHPVQKGVMVVNRKGKPAHTEYEVIEQLGLYTWMRFRIHTGRTHQIRVHCKHIGHPIVCDPVYGDGLPVLLSSFKKKFKLAKMVEEEKPLLSRLALHAHRLVIPMPAGEALQLEAELPRDLAVSIKQLKKWVE